MTDTNNLTEEDVCEYWIKNLIFKKTIEAHKSKDEYVFYDGPPFMNSPMHFGHILAGMIKDTILRHNHNKGMNVPRFNGIDSHGLPIEYEIEKELGIKTTQQVIEYGISNYNKACEKIVLRYADLWEEQSNRLGRWIDFKNQYKTMDLNFMNSVWWVFKTLYDKGRVYEGVRIMGYSTACGTPLSNFEIQQNYQEIQDDSLYIKLKIKNSKLNKFADCWILVWTTTPWTLTSNYALCVGENIDYVVCELDNEKYICAEKLLQNIFLKKQPVIIEKFKGTELIDIYYEPPFEFNNLVEHFVIIGGNFVTDTDGTGIVHIAPNFGQDDYAICLEKNIITRQTKLFEPLDTNGYVNDTIPELKGMFYKNYQNKNMQDLNTWVTIELKKKNFYFDKRTIIHNYPFCWRSDTPLIYKAVNSWFVKVDDMRERLCELNQQINWFPKSIGENRFNNWLANAKDWGISRNRFWGTPIPIWKSPTNKIICVGSSYELERLCGLEYGSITNIHRDYIDNIKIEKDGEVYERINDIFDCWFESGSMPYGTIGNIGIVEILEKHCKNYDSGLFYDDNNYPYIQTDELIIDDNLNKPIRQQYKILPADFIAEGLDQTRGWFYTLLVLSTSLFDIIPFKNVIVNGLILASDGKKMSKRLKNYPEPMLVVNKYGSDALRLYLLSSQAVRAEPLKFTESSVYDMKKDIIIPLSNSIVFLKEYMELYFNTYQSNPIFSIKTCIEQVQNPINLWILRKYSDIRNEFDNLIINLDLKNAVSVLFKLVQILNNGYIKMGRNLIKGKETHDEWKESLSVLYYIVSFILNDFKSILPFFCEIQYLGLKDFLIKKMKMMDNFDLSIHLVEQNNFVVLSQEQISKSIDFDIIYNIIIQIYQMRSLNNLSLKKPVKTICLIWQEELETRYSSRFKEYLNMVMEETNTLNLKILNPNQINIDKKIIPIKALFFKAFGKEISNVFERILKLNTDELEQIIKDNAYYDEQNNKTYQIETTWFNQNYNIDLLEQNNQEDIIKKEDLVVKEFDFEKFKDKIIILIDKSWNEINDKIYYYRLVATSIQKSRKNAKLHPWDNIVALWNGEPKYTLDSTEAQDYIEKITRIKLLKFNNNDVQNNIIHTEKFDNLGININLLNC